MAALSTPSDSQHRQFTTATTKVNKSITMAESEAAKTYRGNCHCGSYVFEVRLPEIKSTMVCNCSICTKKSYMWLYPPKESFTVIKDDGILSEYKFGSFGITHKVFFLPL